MKLTFLGVSSGLSAGYLNFNSNMVLENNAGDRLLIDCGSDIRFSLTSLGYSSKDITAVYISHLHSDHVGGLEWLVFSKYFAEKKKIPLFVASDIINTLWNNVLVGGMSTLENTQVTFNTFFDVMNIHNSCFEFAGCGVQLIKVPHTYSNHKLLPSYGLLITSREKKIFISTDTRFDFNTLGPIYNEADLIFHDCETSNICSNQHARYDQLIHLPSNIKNKMWLYHYNDGELPNAIEDGFCGFVQRGQQFEF